MHEYRPVSLKTLLGQRPLQIVLATTLTLRIVMSLVPELPHYTDDSAGYLDSGVNLFTHATFAMTCDPRCIPTLWRTPGYPIVLGLLVGVLKLPLGAVYVLQAVLDTVTTLLVAAIAWGAAGRRAGILAASVHGLNPFAAVFAGQIMTESVATLTLIAAVYVLWGLCQPARSARSIAWIALGLLLGFATLVRPALAPLSGLLPLAVFERARWREQARGWLLAAGAFAVMVAPWVARNWVTTRDGAADDSFRVLGSFSSPFYRRIATPGLERWYQTFEEPFVWDRPREPPVVAKYFLPGEKERVERLFEGLRDAGVMVTPELDTEFNRLADERIAAHPFRTTIWPPLSRAGRLWVTPRLSSFGIESARLAGARGKLLFVAATGYNALLALFGFATGLVLARRVVGRLLLSVPFFLTALHAFVMWGNQSRYTVPGFPEMAILATLGVLFLLDRIRRRWRSEPKADLAPRAA
jgi:4-amino-4-deoxy-L-arabinose transferase-like glycosyltransferase